jgi:hypothetical protein
MKTTTILAFAATLLSASVAAFPSASASSESASDLIKRDPEAFYYGILCILRGEGCDEVKLKKRSVDEIKDGVAEALDCHHDGKNCGSVKRDPEAFYYGILCILRGEGCDEVKKRSVEEAVH